MFSDRHGVPFPWNDTNKRTPQLQDLPDQGIAEFPGIRVKEHDELRVEEHDEQDNQNSGGNDNEERE